MYEFIMRKKTLNKLIKKTFFIFYFTVKYFRNKNLK